MTTLDPCGYITSSTIFSPLCGSYEEPYHLRPSWRHPYQNVFNPNSSCHALIKCIKKICLGAPFKHKIELFRKRASEKAPEGAQTTRLASLFCVNQRTTLEKLDDTKGLGVWEVWGQFYLICPRKVLPNYLSRLQL